MCMCFVLESIATCIFLCLTLFSHLFTSSSNTFMCFKYKKNIFPLSVLDVWPFHFLVVSLFFTALRVEQIQYLTAVRATEGVSCSDTYKYTLFFSNKDSVHIFLI